MPDKTKKISWLSKKHDSGYGEHRDIHYSEGDGKAHKRKDKKLFD